jgi:DNA-binding NarL/FixJ family response regulator
MKIRTVLAENSAFLRRALVPFLKEAPQLDVVGVSFDMPHALAMLVELQPDVLVFNLEMAMDDEKILSEARASSPRSAMVAMSFLQSREMKSRLQEQGVNCIVSKDKLSQDLVPAIIRCAQERQGE